MVVFDLETTELIEDDVEIEDMSVSVACAMWLPAAATLEAAMEDAASKTFWHESVTRAPNGEAAAGVRELLDWLDGAAMIVAYNGREFDMRVLSRYYHDGEDDRRQAHLAKLVDPAEAVQRAAGRRAKLSTVLRLNTKAQKGGEGCDAPRWWHDGRHTQLQRYCAQDVRVLADLVVRPEIRVPGGGVTREASVLRVLTDVAAPAIPHAGICHECGRAAAASAGGDVGARVSDAFIRKLHEHGVTEARDITTRTVDEYRTLLGGLTAAELAQLRSVGVRTDAEARLREAYLRKLADDAPLDLGATRAHEERAASSRSGEHCAACGGGKRKRRATGAYDETRRRKARRTTPRGYMDRGGRDWVGCKRGAIVLGEAAVERTVAGRYEWRDRGMSPVRGARKRHWEDEHEPSHRAQRPRTDGGQ